MMSAYVSTAALRRNLGRRLSSRAASTTSKRFVQTKKQHTGLSASSFLRDLPARSFSSPSAPPPSSTDLVQSSSVANSASESGTLPTHPIDFDVASKIEGNESQIVTVELEPGQILRAESGAMMYMTDGVEMNTTTGGGLSSGFQRMLTVRACD